MIVVLDNLRSALNVGSIIRTCEALGISDIYFCGITPGPDSPKVKKTSLGAEMHIRASTNVQTLDVVRKFKDEGKQVLALEITDDAKTITGGYRDAVIVIGNEISGISEEILALCDETVMIPMRGTKESLNVSVAFGIAAYTLAN